MTPRRLALLEEMGLTPVWRLRGTEVPVAESEVVESAAPEAVAAEVIERASASGHPVAEMQWDALRAAITGCQACALGHTRKQAVPGVGPAEADWMIVGEAPGAEEDARGEPFVGQAGLLLDQMLAAIDLNRREHVYIANVLKCRPPGNRNPAPEEIEQCLPYLKRQIELVRPRLLIAMGRFAAQTLLNTDASIASLRGKRHDYHGVPLIVTYHPAYLLRSLPEKAKAWEDLCFARATMQALQSA